ncbi:MAG: NAD(P)-binding domain-containing protein, partial [Gaiellaceae bacterium]
MKIAIVGGTGSFGRALAQRLRVLGRDVAIGSRDEDRARELAAVYGVEGGLNEDVVRDADLVVLSTRSAAALETARVLADAIGETPLL